MKRYEPKPMKNINEIVDNGFSVSCSDGGLTEIALFSLRKALKNYFSTYRYMASAIHLFCSGRTFDQATIDSSHSPQYWEACSETILHFQHFIELILKNLLYMEHPLLAVDASSNHVIFHEFLKREKIPAHRYEKLRLIDFNKTLKRIGILIKKDRIGAGRFGFIYKNRKSLEKLNQLRNRLWHKGIFVLRYPALDQFIGGYILPFVKEVLSLREFSGREMLWKYRSLSCSIDPFDEIIKECQRETFDLGKTAFLKELARAAFENPLQKGVEWAELLNRECSEKAERWAMTGQTRSKKRAVHPCPVCGINALVISNETWGKRNYPDYCKRGKQWSCIWEARCMCCTFQIDNHLSNPGKYGFSIDDEWAPAAGAEQGMIKV